MTRPPVSDRLIAIAASAGGFAAVRTILQALPSDFPYPILLLLHLMPDRESHLADLLNNVTPLRVIPAENLALPAPGTVYVAPPNRHLTVDQECRLRLEDTEPVHFARPSADVLFDSLAACCPTRTVGILCTGFGRDGATGLGHLRQAGGRTIAQDQATSEHFGMPGTAIKEGAAQQVLALNDIAAALFKLSPTE